MRVYKAYNLSDGSPAPAFDCNTPKEIHEHLEGHSDPSKCTYFWKAETA